MAKTIDGLLKKWGIAYPSSAHKRYHIHALRPQSNAYDPDVTETFRINATNNGESKWHEALKDISAAIEASGLDCAVELIDLDKFPRYHSCGLEDALAMTTKHRTIVKQRASDFLATKKAAWYAMFVLRLGESS